MNHQTTEQIYQQVVYEQGRIDADADHAVDILYDRITRAQAFRVCRGRQLRASTLVRLGMADLIAAN